MLITGFLVQKVGKEEYKGTSSKDKTSVPDWRAGDFTGRWHRLSSADGYFLEKYGNSDCRGYNP